MFINKDMNQPWMTSGFLLGLSLIIFFLFSSVDPSVIYISSVILCISGFLLSMKSVPQHPGLLDGLSCCLLIIGGSSEAIVHFPDRILAILALVPVISYFCGRALRSNEPGLAFLICCIGLSSAPYTELYLDRDLFSLTAAALMMIHTFSLCDKPANGVSKTKPGFSQRALTVLLMFTLFSTVAFLTSLVSVYPYISFRMTGIFLFYLLMLMTALVILRKSENRFELVYFLLTLSSIYLAFVFFAGCYRIHFMGFFAGLQFRLFPFNRHPNYIILPILLTLPMWLLLTSHEKSSWTRRAGWIGFLFSLFYFFIWSYSRASWIIIFVNALVLYTGFRKKISRSTRQIFFSVSIVSVFAFLFILQSQWQRFTSIFSWTGSSRIVAWEALGSLIFQNPFTGYGLSTNRYIYPQALDTIAISTVPTRQYLVEAHNAYIDICAGCGILGLLLFLTFLWFCTSPLKQAKSLSTLIAKTIGYSVWIDLLFNFRFHAHDLGLLVIVILAWVFRHQESDAMDAHPYYVIKNPRPVILGLLLILMMNALPAVSKLFVSKAQSLLETGNWQKIEKYYRAASIFEPLNSHPHYYLFLVYQQSGDPELAMEEISNAIRLNPNFAFYRYELAKEFLRQNKVQQAFSELEIARNLEPNEASGKYRFLSGILNPEGLNSTEVRADIWTSILVNPDLLGDPFWKDHEKFKYELARDFIIFFKYFSFHEDKVDLISKYYHNLTSIFLKLDLFPLIEEGYRNCYEKQIQNDNFITAFAIFFMQLNNLEESEKLLEDGLLIHPDSSNYLNLLAAVCIKKSEFDRAQELLRKSIRNWRHLSIDNIEAYRMLLNIYESVGKDDLAEELRIKLAYLTGGVYSIQRNDLIIHGGSNIPEIKIFEALNSRDKDSSTTP